MNKGNYRNIDNDDSSESFGNSSVNDVHSSDETSSQMLLHRKKRKFMSIRYSSDEENNVEIENVDSLDDGLKSGQPIDHFKKFITNELITEIITQTNLYANEQIEKKELFSRSVWKNWKNVSYDEMLAFFGVILIWIHYKGDDMGTI
ncbi:uncharacterized protein LOC124424760 [Vespa crabro]|uniref:uncharacterized protein LOC124424760 n=1 Tax=Vespa crabro TaxID=7445 RepID=UPI001F004DA3|nr:uncharacterized protein LOC124424760 [Vespa crabro]